MNCPVCRTPMVFVDLVRGESWWYCPSCNNPKLGYPIIEKKEEDK